MRSENGRWAEEDLPAELPSGEVAVVEFLEAGFFAEVPPLRDVLPDPVPPPERW